MCIVLYFNWYRAQDSGKITHAHLSLEPLSTNCHKDPLRVSPAHPLVMLLLLCSLLFMLCDQGGL